MYVVLLTRLILLRLWRYISHLLIYLLTYSVVWARVARGSKFCDPTGSGKNLNVTRPDPQAYLADFKVIELLNDGDRMSSSDITILLF